MLESIAEILPLIITALVPPLVAAGRALVQIPSRWIPVLLPVGGGVLAGLGALVGVDVSPSSASDPEMLANAITGILIGAAAVGLHQIKKQGEK